MDRARLLLRLVPYLKGHWPALALGTFLALVVSGAEGLIAWLVKPAMDEIFLKRDLVMLKVSPLVLLGAYLLTGAARCGQSYLMAAVGERVIARIRGELHGHIQAMPLAFFKALHSAELMARVSFNGWIAEFAQPPCRRRIEGVSAVTDLAVRDAALHGVPLGLVHSSGDGLNKKVCVVGREAR